MMIAPSVLPGRAFQRIDRVSRCLFHWRAADFSLRALTGQAGTLTRASAGGMTTDARGALVAPVHSQPRFTMVDLDGDGARETPTLLLERSTTNLIANSTDMSTWLNSNTTVAAAAVRAPDHGANSWLLTSTSLATNARYTDTAFTGDGTKVVSLHCRQGSASAFRVAIYDATAGLARHYITVTWTAGVPVLSTISGTGTLFAPERLTDGWWRIAFTASGVVAANTNRLYIYPSVSGTDETLFFGAQAENNLVPSSYVRTTGTVAARAVDELSFAFDALPQSMTIYSSHVEAGTIALGVSSILWNIGTVNPPRIVLLQPSGQGVYRVQLELTSGTHSASQIAAPPIGAVVELCVTLRGTATDSELQLIQSIDGAAPTATSIATGGTLPAAWSSSLLRVNSVGGGAPGLAKLRAIKIAAGIRTLDEMRELL